MTTMVDDTQELDEFLHGLEESLLSELPVVGTYESEIIDWGELTDNKSRVTDDERKRTDKPNGAI